MSNGPKYVSLYLCYYLGVRESEHGGELAAVWLGDVLLHGEAALQPLAQQVGEHSSGPGPLALAVGPNTALSRENLEGA